MSEERVAVYDAAGRVAGSAPRSRMRGEGLWHAAVSILVLSPDRSTVYVHRRTETKDIHPGMHNCWAGGVVAAGESPDEAASRELAEELGIDATPEPIRRTTYERGSVRYHAYLYEVRWDGPITHQAEEISDGWWMSLSALRARLADPEWPFVPDGRQFIEQWFAQS